jgi:hypothetical protein
MSQTDGGGDGGSVSRSQNRNPAGPFRETTPEEGFREVDLWVADARRRGLPELEPLLRGLAQATLALRAADWNDSVAPRVPPASPAGGR